MSDPIQVNVTPPAPITVTVTGGVGPQGPAGAGGVTTLQGLNGALTLAAVGGNWTASGSTITFTVTSAGAVAWADITGKPATFTPAAHTHTIADVTGLQTALDGKQAAGSYAAASHTHTASAVTDFSAAALLAVTWSTLTGKPAFAQVATSGLYSDLTGTPAAYSLPVATSSVLGGVKQGANVTIDGTGVISVAAPVTSLAWTAITGKPTFATVATTGAYSDLTGTPAAYSLPTASASVLGGIKIGSGLTIDGTGTVTAAGTYTLPTASATVLGGVKIGSGISIDGAGVISASAGYTLPAATTSTLGGVIVGTGLAVSSGTVSVSYGTTSTTACVGNDSRLSDARTPTSHTHGPIANDGTIARTSPTQITADQNNYAGFAAGINRFSTDAARTMTGIVAGSDGEVRILHNIGSSFALTIANDSASSTAGNRIYTPTAANFSIPPNVAVMVWYDGTSSRWRIA